MSTATKHQPTELEESPETFDAQAMAEAVHRAEAGGLDGEDIHIHFRSLEIILRYHPEIRKFTPKAVVDCVKQREIFAWQFELRPGDHAVQITEDAGEGMKFWVHRVVPRCNSVLADAWGYEDPHFVMGICVQCLEPGTTDLPFAVDPWDHAFPISKAQADAFAEAGHPTDPLRALEALTEAGPIVSWAAAQIHRADSAVIGPSGDAA